MMKLLILIFPMSFALSFSYELEEIYYVQGEESGAEEQEDFQQRPWRDTVTDEQAQKSNATSVDDILHHAPSATTARGPRSSAQSIQIRGMQADKISISIDGARQNFQQGHSSMLPVDLDNLKRVDIEKNVSAINQTSSLSGSINFISKDPKDYLRPGETSAVEFKTHTNSANQEQGISAKTAYRKSHTGILLGLSQAKAQNLKLNDGSTLANSAFEDVSFFSKITHKKLRLKFERFVRQDNNPLDPTLNPPDRLTELLSDNKTTRDLFNIDYGNTIGAYITGHRTEQTRRSDAQKQTRLLQTAGLRLSEKTTTHHYGAQIYQDRLDSDLEGAAIESYPKAQGTYAFAYYEHTLRSGSFAFSPGLKFNAYELESDDMASMRASALGAKASLNYTPNPYFSADISYSEGFNAPRANQVYPQGLHSPGDDFVIRDNFFLPNPQLTHETSRNTELGLSYQNSLFGYEDLITLKASLYNNEIRDYIRLERIDRSILDDQDGTTQFVNIANAQLRGAEIGLAYRFARWETGLDYTQARGKDLDSNLYLEDLPADQYRYKLSYHHEELKLSLGLLSIQYMEQNRVNPQTIQRTEKTPAALVHNIFIAKGLGETLETNLSVHNVGNQRYRRHASHLNEARQDIRFSLKYKINAI